MYQMKTFKPHRKLRITKLDIAFWASMPLMVFGYPLLELLYKAFQ